MRVFITLSQKCSRLSLFSFFSTAELLSHHSVDQTWHICATPLRGSFFCGMMLARGNFGWASCKLTSIYLIWILIWTDWDQMIAHVKALFNGIKIMTCQVMLWWSSGSKPSANIWWVGRTGRMKFLYLLSIIILLPMSQKCLPICQRMKIYLRFKINRKATWYLFQWNFGSGMEHPLTKLFLHISNEKFCLYLIGSNSL